MYATKYHAPDDWGLTSGERRVFSVLMANKIATHAQVLAALEYEPRFHDISPSPESVQVLIHRLRQKLTDHGVIVQNIHGVGYSMKGMVK